MPQPKKNSILILASQIDETIKKNENLNACLNHLSACLRSINDQSQNVGEEVIFDTVKTLIAGLNSQSKIERIKSEINSLEITFPNLTKIPKPMDY